jgi:hypothetical protein
MTAVKGISLPSNVSSIPSRCFQFFEFLEDICFHPDAALILLSKRAFDMSALKRVSVPAQSNRSSRSVLPGVER